MNLNLNRLFQGREQQQQQQQQSSRVFVSVSVVSAMRRSGTARHKTRVIIRVSIWTLLCLLLSFFTVYTILLVLVDKQLHPASLSVPMIYRKIKLQGRNGGKTDNGFLNPFVKDQFRVNDTSTTSHRKAVWNSSHLYLQGEVLPQCRQQTLFTLLVTSAPDHHSRRMAIRRSWCNPGNFLKKRQAWKCVFLIGISGDGEIGSKLEAEKNLHGDILLGRYVDSYRNLTLKVLHGFTWSTDHCPSSYLIKTDDDCFVNVGLLYEFLMSYNKQKSELYAGSIIEDKSKLKVIRGAEKKWAVGHGEYPMEYYPPYASGIGYILSADVAKRLVSESAHITPIPNEDAYIGIVMSHLGVNPISSSRFVLSASGLSICNFLYVFIVHHVQTEDQDNLMGRALEARTKCNHSAITTWS